MHQNTVTDALKTIEVPPELRGLSDEEIIRNSEEFQKKFGILLFYVLTNIYRSDILCLEKILALQSNEC